MGRARSLSADTIALWVFAAILVVALLVALLVWVTYPNYDSYYSLLCGDGRSSTGTCRASRPTAHRPSIPGVLFGTLLRRWAATPTE